MILKTLKSIMATGESKNMENLFASLRADHDVGTLKLSKEKIEELKKNTLMLVEIFLRYLLKRRKQMVELTWELKM
ncbi:superfamily II RNA helicase [Solibacillus silvestris StLB046]|uniref:Superfamily II RNA helicase n=1 Tax=Solibacillus silvestris (strain StLB046) TaxID=1002809 RepID=F2F0B3_SOLSS|nr:hypothetical protein [Solibacillus silvestris]BAK15223.1 superfamily II RNA helicase [Solibacillus silvestris StLB046]